MKDEYTFGRGEECDYQFENGRVRNPHFLALSNLHFRIYRVSSRDISWGKARDSLGARLVLEIAWGQG